MRVGAHRPLGWEPYGCPTLTNAPGRQPPIHDESEGTHMAVLERSELQASPLADLHAIADQLGLEGFRRMRKAELINAILGEEGGGGEDSEASASTDDRDEREASRSQAARPRRRSSRSAAPRARRAKAPAEAEEGADGVDLDASAQPGIADGVVELLGNGSAFLRVVPPDPSD